MKKYHPDKYKDSDLKDMASEKLKEVNAAYDEIQRMRQNKSSASYESANGSRYQSSYGNAGYRSSYSSYSSNPKYNTVRSKIQMNDISGAEAIFKFHDGSRCRMVLSHGGGVSAQGLV